MQNLLLKFQILQFKIMQNLVWSENEVLLISWKDFGKIVSSLVKIIPLQYYDTIVGISRGGLMPAVYISNKLKINSFYTVRVLRNKTDSIISYREEIRFEQTIDANLNGKKILLIDDIVGNGETFTKTINHIKEKFYNAEINTVALFVNENASFFPDFYFKKSAKWVVFPWESPPNIKNKNVVRWKDDT